MRRFWIAGIFCTISLQGMDNPILPNAKVQLVTPQLGEGGLISFLGELGARNLRGAVTYANRWAACHRFKASGEFLTQDLRYSSGPRNWSKQYSFGAEYQYFVPNSPFRNFYAAASYIHAYNHGHGLTQISGSNGGQGRVGATVNPWKCAYLSAEVDYDCISYHKAREKVSGFGGTAKIIQYLGREFALRGNAEFHQPYYFYEGAFEWSREFSSCKLHTGVYMNYTQGKEGLPNALGGGLELSLSFGARTEKCCKIEPKWTQKCDSNWMCDLPSWAMESAARIPVVLAIQNPSPSCALPTSSSIPDQEFIGSPTYSFDASPYFSSNTALSYSATGLPAGSSINSTTGVISGPATRTLNHVTVSAANSCGSTSQNFIISFGF